MTQDGGARRPRAAGESQNAPLRLGEFAGKLHWPGAYSRRECSTEALTDRKWAPCHWGLRMGRARHTAPPHAPGRRSLKKGGGQVPS